ncbi:unnamed protein product [Gongylonema pulchrum]|uniref:Pre-mRNA-splicing factor CWC25 homolog n=1 Tax=Gongylonema pulchrum TaxID=637853 RepID=A0A183EMQ4_9BILA|nr:unnamed protein product [Gongylonema pulchrum]
MLYFQVKPWYEKAPEKKKGPDISVSSENTTSKTEVIRKRIKDADSKKHKKHKKHKHGAAERHRKMSEKKRRRHHSSSESLLNEELVVVEEAAKKQKLEKLRQERLEREAKERKRLAELLTPAENRANEAKLAPKYNSQFNPELARQNRPR